MHVTLVHVQVKPAYIDDFIAATRLDHEASIQLVGSKNSSWLGHRHHSRWWWSRMPCHCSGTWLDTNDAPRSSAASYKRILWP